MITNATIKKTHLNLVSINLASSFSGVLHLSFFIAFTLKRVSPPIFNYGCSNFWHVVCVVCACPDPKKIKAPVIKLDSWQCNLLGNNVFDIPSKMCFVFLALKRLYKYVFLF